jgi:cytochrome c oxidase subunit II
MRGYIMILAAALVASVAAADQPPAPGSISRSVDPAASASISRSVDLAASASISRSVDQEAAPTKVIRVSAERFAFTPSRITVDRGTAVEFHLTSQDTDHGFRIVGTEVNAQIPKRRRGETVVRYTADTAGEFTIECSRPCGAGHTAMYATLVVK